MGSDIDRCFPLGIFRIYCLPLFLLQTEIEKTKDEEKSNTHTRNSLPDASYHAGNVLRAESYFSQITSLRHQNNFKYCKRRMAERLTCMPRCGRSEVQMPDRKILHSIANGLPPLQHPPTQVAVLPWCYDAELATANATMRIMKGLR